MKKILLKHVYLMKTSISHWKVYFFWT